MFTYINNQGVISQKGFTVQRTGRFTAEYHDGSRKIEIGIQKPCLDHQKRIIAKFGPTHLIKPWSS